MTGILEKIKRSPMGERLTEAYEVRAFRDESEQPEIVKATMPEVPHPEPRVLEVAKNRVLGHGEQRVVPDDCQFGDNDMCNGES